MWNCDTAIITYVLRTYVWEIQTTLFGFNISYEIRANQFWKVFEEKPWQPRKSLAWSELSCRSFINRVTTAFGWSTNEY